MAIRFAKSHVVAISSSTAGFDDGSNITADGLRVLTPVRQWIRMAPSRYSNVRKVTFSCALQWFENDASRNVDVRLLVGPMSTSSSARVIHGLYFPLASLVTLRPSNAKLNATRNSRLETAGPPIVSAP